MRSWRMSVGGMGLITLDGNWPDNIPCPLHEIPEGDVVYFKNIMPGTTLVFDRTAGIVASPPLAMLNMPDWEEPKIYLSSLAGMGPDIIGLRLKPNWEIHLVAYEELFTVPRLDRYCRYFWRRRVRGIPAISYDLWNEAITGDPVSPVPVTPNQQLIKQIQAMFPDPVPEPKRGGQSHGIIDEGTAPRIMGG